MALKGSMMTFAQRIIMATSSIQRKAMQARVNPRSTSTKAGSVVLSISMMAMVVCCCPQTGAHFQLPFWRGFCKCKGEEGRVKHKTDGAKGQGTKTYPCFKCHNDMHEKLHSTSLNTTGGYPQFVFKLEYLISFDHWTVCDLIQLEVLHFHSVDLNTLLADKRVYFTSLTLFQRVMLLASETFHQPH